MGFCLTAPNFNLRHYRPTSVGEGGEAPLGLIKFRGRDGRQRRSQRHKIEPPQDERLRLVHGGILGSMYSHDGGGCPSIERLSAHSTFEMVCDQPCDYAPSQQSSDLFKLIDCKPSMYIRQPTSSY